MEGGCRCRAWPGFYRVRNGQEDQAVLDIVVAELEPESAVTEGKIDRVEALSDELRRFGGVEPAGHERGWLYRSLPGSRRVTVASGLGSGFQPAMVRAHSRACRLSVIAGNSRRSSIAADNSPC
jgi:hypothetical protein